MSPRQRASWVQSYRQQRLHGDPPDAVVILGGTMDASSGSLRVMVLRLTEHAVAASVIVKVGRVGAGRRPHRHPTRRLAVWCAPMGFRAVAVGAVGTTWSRSLVVAMLMAGS